jgi:hypothetical protein
MPPVFRSEFITKSVSRFNGSAERLLGSLRHLPKAKPVLDLNLN